MENVRNSIIIAVSTALLLLFIIIGVVVGVVISRRGGSDDQTTSNADISNAIKMICAVTRYPESCYSSLMAIAGGGNETNVDPEELLKISLRIAHEGFQRIKNNISERRYIAANHVNDLRVDVKDALEMCTEMIDDSVDSLDKSLNLLKPRTPGEIDENILGKSKKINSLRTYLSAVITNADTCLDGLDGFDGFGDKLEASLRNSTEFTSNSLAIATRISSLLQAPNIPLHRRLLSSSILPDWVESADSLFRRRVLMINCSTIPKVDVIVDQNDTRRQQHLKTINEALSLVPEKNNASFVIYVVAGKYLEDVLVTKKMWNVMMIGDGMNTTIVSGNKNAADGTPTFHTAPFKVEGRGFIAIDMGFENTAGPEKKQAVAVRTNADEVIFYRCTFDAYQDTLYTHSFRQFYRECDIRGTIDFIFGDAAVVFQNCTIRPRQPMHNQYNVITAQGRSDPGENTGISIQNCTILAFDNLTRPTYLGRPWKNYSTTVFMESFIGGGVVDAKGWIALNPKQNLIPPRTIFYGERENTGPGANTTERVQWDGYNPKLSIEEAKNFTVTPFIQGNQWLPKSGVPYVENLDLNKIN